MRVELAVIAHDGGERAAGHVDVEFREDHDRDLIRAGMIEELEELLDQLFERLDRGGM